MKKVFVCSPLKGNTEENIRKAKRYCTYVVACGYLPVAPHVYFTTFLEDSNAEEREIGMTMGLELLLLCDELWIFGKESEGMKTEIMQASKQGIMIIKKEMV